MTIVGCYVLDLYCDAVDHKIPRYVRDAQYTAERGATARQEARRDGWLIRKTRAVCPACRTAERSGT